MRVSLLKNKGPLPCGSGPPSTTNWYRQRLSVVVVCVVVEPRIGWTVVSSVVVVDEVTGAFFSTTVVQPTVKNTAVSASARKYRLVFFMSKISGG